MGCAKPHATHWKDLRSRSAERVLAHPGVVTSAQGGGYEMTFLVDRYFVDPVAERIDGLGAASSELLSDAFQILLLNYLLAPNGGPDSGELISEKELPGGATFFRGPHALPVESVVARYGTDVPGFEARSLELGGETASHGDCAMRFQPLGSISMTYILWQADDEFGASMSALFDRSISRWFALDSIFMMAGEVSRRLVDPLTASDRP